VPTVEAVVRIESELAAASGEASRFLERVDAARPEHSNTYEVPEELREVARNVSARFHAPLVRLASMVRESPMFGAADLSAVQLVVRRIDAVLRLRRYEEWGPEILHNEDTVLGVRPAGFSEDQRLRPAEALAELNDAVEHALRRTGVLRAQAEAEAANEAAPARAPVVERPGFQVQPGTAFIMMMIDPTQPGLEDVKQAIKEEFARFEIRATRSDEIEHSDEITARILQAIKESEFLIADLTGERPSVYYEVGYAHAIGKRPILFRKQQTRLHFDLAVHNCPEYANVTELRSMLRRRLAAVTGRE
jgi:hypothetical protein